eukprot:56675-Eustigmatos_ZCMA.PRE.1
MSGPSVSAKFSSGVLSQKKDGDTERGGDYSSLMLRRYERVSASEQPRLAHLGPPHMSSRGRETDKQRQTDRSKDSHTHRYS